MAGYLPRHHHSISHPSQQGLSLPNYGYFRIRAQGIIIDITGNRTTLRTALWGTIFR